MGQGSLDHYLKYTSRTPDTPEEKCHFVFKWLYHDRYVQTAALLDTGADFNVFHADIADYLGIKLTTGKTRRISGINKGIIKGYEHGLDIKIGDYRFKTSITFSRNLPDNSIAVLGNQGFFDHFTVAFNYHDKEIILRHFAP